MRYLTFLLAATLLIFGSKCFAQEDSLRAQKIFEMNIKIIEKYLLNKNADTGYKRISAIRFLEQLTDLGSESSAGYIGKTSPTHKDLLRWKEWYENNKYNLYWDDKSNAVVLHKLVVPIIK